MKTLRAIDPAALVPMDLFTGDVPLRVDVAYTQDFPKSFCGVLYRPDVRLWLHQDLAAVVVRAAAAAGKAGLGMILYDGLRTTEAQKLMGESAIVQANPHWLEGDKRMVSPPGKGAHPRAMAIDLTLCDAEGVVLDMGTAFDAMPPNGAGPGPETNPAHRDAVVEAAVKANRDQLTRFMMEAAMGTAQFLMPLPQEWWDYRFMPMTYDVYAPLSDADLPRQMRMTDVCLDAAGPADFDGAHFEKLRAAVLKRAGL
ncbi:MAG: D-Ala-D-Ala dipeptidase [Alphaproteobacteria bacterium]|nr:D-Ala-D-Ala dipeptidase [Alphaproteobacteria bacterium]